MNSFHKLLTLFLILAAGMPCWAQPAVDYSVVSVPEEASLELLQVSTPGDYVCMPEVKRRGNRIDWLSNRVLDTSPDGKSIAYLSLRNGATNIFIKDLGRQGSSMQRTNRQAVWDFSYSPDGKYLCFSEKRGTTNQIFQTDAENGYVCRQITQQGSNDYSPAYTPDMQGIFFARQENRGVSIWSYDIKNNFLSSFTSGMNPCPLPDGEKAFLCARINAAGQSEIWKINYESGVEECLISDPERSFTTPSVSPDGQWILFVGNSKVQGPKGVAYQNTDIYAARIDGTGFHQLTYHATDDLSPVWSRDGKYIYFLSQRGNAEGTCNIWRMTFQY